MFDRNHGDFLSFVHRNLWSNGLLLLPPNDSTDQCFVDLYNYKSGMFIDMYDNPTSYQLNIEDISRAMGTQTWRQAHLSALWNKDKQRQNTLGEIERTNLPHHVCKHLITYLQEDDGEYFMSKAHFDKYFTNSIIKKCSYKITHTGFFTMLQRCGLQALQKDDRVFFINEKYPQMFIAIFQWKKLLEPSRKNKDKYKYDSAFHHLDYRFFSPHHKLGYQNSHWYMSDTVINYLSEIHDFALRRDKTFTKLDNTLRIAIGFRLKGQGFFEFEHKDGFPTMQLKLFHSDSKEYRNFETKVNALPNADEVRTTILSWVRRCYRCPCRPVPSASMIGNVRTIFGREMKLCGPYLNLITTDFSQKSLEIMKIILESTV